ncbi:hypothetical protein [Legionella micdadei]|uniref:Uncharacterized protein n=1 Tax=Legionella micdadei TaxID=451 RepID=A0A098GFU6_LEGMI|nr:hypothetical protein [Legionella micdadei]ARG97574.1 hypothetical protein B6N58_07790 [Legionella micdadei]ARH00113.1 hypothetical protein B6V88_06635 [Legionella micdadei]KTD27652.1 hypothetical protein Lmic_1972 [Legionella micdadei]NSL17636.1 hypothetical protein [Legionella micdadei]CEG60862.1 exported protein of unknown function [Legionella micdadei]
MARRLGARFFTPLATAATGAGAAYLTQQLYEFKQFQEKLGLLSSSTEPPERSIVEAEQKEWLLFGRQSPGYVRDPSKNPKNHIWDQITQSSKSLRSLATHMDNESHYELLAGSDFVTEPFTQDPKAPKVLIKPEKMIGKELREIGDDEQFEVNFARKQAFAKETAKHSPFYHSSFALRKVSEERPASPSAVVISGKEAKELIQDINETICEPQYCTMYTSNCYSASMYGTGALAKIIDRKSDIDESKKKADIQSIADVAKKVSQDNFGRGVSNNPVVNVQLTSELPKLMEKHGLIHTQGYAPKL